MTADIVVHRANNRRLVIEPDGFAFAVDDATHGMDVLGWLRDIKVKARTIVLTFDSGMKRTLHKGLR